jgi:hypothetical protein
MFLVDEELPPLTTTNQGVGVRYDSGLVESLPVCFAHKRACACVVAANPRMNVL